LVLNHPGANVGATFGTATVGALASWSSLAPINLTGTTTFKSADAAGNPHNLSLGGGLSGIGGLITTGLGLVILNGTNTYAGPTLITAGKLLVNGALAAGGTVTVTNGGALSGTGLINGPVAVQSGGTLSCGVSVGYLTFGNSLVLAAGATNLFAISASPPTNLTVNVNGALTCGGTLIVTNLGATPLAPGESFQLFNASSYNGGFANVVLPGLPAGLGWNTDGLNTSGTLSVVVTARPFIGSVAFSSSGFMLTGTGGVAQADYYLLGTTNLASPLSNWTRLLTNQFDQNGNFNFTNPITPNLPQGYYLIQGQ
jgi:autotransporter-associated beta strand protein